MGKLAASGLHSRSLLGESVGARPCPDPPGRLSSSSAGASPPQGPARPPPPHSQPSFSAHFAASSPTLLPPSRQADFRRLVQELNALLQEQRSLPKVRFAPALPPRSHSAADLAGGPRRERRPRRSRSSQALRGSLCLQGFQASPPSPRAECRLGHDWRRQPAPSPPPVPRLPVQPDPLRLPLPPRPRPSALRSPPPPDSASASLFCLDMGQRLARQDVDEGVRLYHLQKHEEAVARWRAALRRLKTPEDRFITMGYLAQAYCESGAYQDMLVFALQQIELGNAQEDSYMRAEAFLNLARANERLCEFTKAVQYGRHSLENASMDPRTPGYAYLCIGSSFLGFSNFQLALDHFEQAMRVANATQDRLLELQICVALGSLFTQLKDLSKAVVFLKNALGLLKTVSIVDVQAKYRSLVLYHLSVALRRKGAMTDAKQAAEEALRLAAENGNRPIQGRCLHALGDIHREYRDVEKTWSRYEAGLALLETLEDRGGQLWLLASMAKTALLLQRPGHQHCECQAIQLNKKCLELSKAMGSRLGMLKAHGRLAAIYAGLQDEESEDVARKAATGLTQEMELFCNFCGQRYALADNSLQALPCSHIFHEKCLQTYLSGRERKECPKCEHRAATLASLPSTSQLPPAPEQSPHPRVLLGADSESLGPPQSPPPPPSLGNPSTSTNRSSTIMGSSVSPPPGIDLARIGTRSPSLDEQRPPTIRLDEAKVPSPIPEASAPASPATPLSPHLEPSEPPALAASFHALQSFKPISRPNHQPPVSEGLKHQDTGFASSSPTSSTATLQRPSLPPPPAQLASLPSTSQNFVGASQPGPSSSLATTSHTHSCQVKSKSFTVTEV